MSGVLLQACDVRRQNILPAKQRLLGVVMPDKLKQTISATEMSGLLGVSPYVTKWMLYQRFAKGIQPTDPEHNRLSWGTKMEPLLLDQAAADLRFEVTTNGQPDGLQIYVHRGLFGC